MKGVHIFLGFGALLPLCCTQKKEDKNNGLQATNSPITMCFNPQTTDLEWFESGLKAPLLPGLEGIDFPISTTSQEAQNYFNQGMMLSYGFNHAEAARSFYEASRLDSNCAMAWWGFAYVLGPNYNGGMEEGNFQRAWDAITRAQNLATQATDKEKSLIRALSYRYAKEPPADRMPLDIAYSKAMRDVFIQYPGDPDIGALYAESLMDLHPWDLYEKKTKKPKSWTPELVAMLEGLLKKHPNHPGAHHLYIHALEASLTPEKALPSAAMLDTLVAGSGHLLHMPSHIYINTGDYHLGSASNVRAVQTDSNYLVSCHAQGTYPLAYFPHNYHFLSATATLEGNSGLAWKAAQKVQEYTAKEVMRMPGWGTLQHYYTIPLYVAVKFSMWEPLLALPAPDKDLIYPTAIWHYAKGMAFLSKNDLSRAKEEVTKLELLASDTTLLQLTVWDINTTADLAQIALKVLSAGIAGRENQLPKCIALLQEAVVIEDNLNYNEPPDWFFSVRHHLGAVLLKAGKPEEAEKVYREDLLTWKKNGWALMGLYNSLLQQKKNKEAEDVKSAFDASWQYSDIKITQSSDLIH